MSQREQRDDEFPRLRRLRVGIHVSLGARQAVRSVGTALGMEAPRVNSVARQVPLLSSPGAIDNVMMHAPELGIPDAGAGVEPYNTLVRVAGQLEGLPHRYGAHPSAYTFSFYGPGVLAWLPAQWVSDGGPGRRRSGCVDSPIEPAHPIAGKSRCCKVPCWSINCRVTLSGCHC